jgi:YbbR domain-containing protein
VLTSRARSSIIGQIKGDLQLERIAPDSLYFEFTQLAQKKVEVKPNINYTFEKQYMLSGPIKVLPDSITISGPSTLIDTINSVTTDVVNLDKLTSTEDLSVSLNGINQVGFSNRRVNITIPVEKFTEASIKQVIEIRNLPDTLRLILIPRSVDITCNVTINSYKNLRENLEVFVDFRDLHSIMDNRLPVQLVSQPYVVENLKFEPMFVEFIIEKL